MDIRCLQSFLSDFMSRFLLLQALVRFFLNLLAFLESISPLLRFSSPLPATFCSDLRTIYSHCVIFSLALPALNSLSVSSLSFSFDNMAPSFPSSSLALILFHIIQSLFLWIQFSSVCIFILKNVGMWSLSMSMVSITLWSVISVSLSAIVQSISEQLTYPFVSLLLFFTCLMQVHSWGLLWIFRP